MRALEDVVSARALTASARELGLVNPTPEAVLQLAASGDPAARQVIDRFVEGISAAVIAINAVLDPECVILGGGIGIRLQDHVAEISDAVTRCSPFHVDLDVAKLHTDATLRGAVDMGLETARNAMFRLGVRDDAS